MSLGLKKRYLMSLVQSGGGVSPRLPSGYQEVEYVEGVNTGNNECAIYLGDATYSQNELKNINHIKTTSRDYVKIDNVEYNKNFQMDTIAQLVLHKCNITHSKSKYNLNSLRNKTGKLMITKGMSVKDFKNKYNV